MTSIQLLEALQASIPRELPKLELDYSMLHSQRIGLLRRLKRQLDEDYVRFYGGARYIENESQLPWLAPYAFMVSRYFPMLGTAILYFTFVGCVSPDPPTVVCLSRKADSHRLQQAQREQRRR